MSAIGDGLGDFLKVRAAGDLIAWKDQLEASRQFGVGIGVVELAALEAGLLPMRYRRNRVTLSVEDQSRLFRSRVAVVGCGGLGGYIVEELARLGVGSLVLVDPDAFEEHNLNRQLLSTPALLGRVKVEVGRERVAEVNPAVTVVAHHARFSAENARELFSGCTAVMDGLDSAVTRRELATACRDLAVPLVHGAIAGWYGQVTVQMPGSDISPIFMASPEATGVETVLGNPSFTPAVVASLQVAEVVKLLLGRGAPLVGRVLFVNLLDMRFDEVRLT